MPTTPEDPSSAEVRGELRWLHVLVTLLVLVLALGTLVALLGGDSAAGALGTLGRLAGLLGG